MTDKEQKKAAKDFAEYWKGRGDEKQETQTFWLTLLRKVFDIDEPDKFISFEKTVKVDNIKTGKSTTKFIDGYIGTTRVLIEQKGAKINLRKGEIQSDGSLLSPYQQARRYGGYMNNNEQPRWIIVCNFQTFEIHDMNRPNDEPDIIELKNLPKEYTRLKFLVDTGSELLKQEMEISIKAGEIVGVLYEKLLAQYKNPDENSLKSLNALCVRLVFCLYAEDADIFGKHLLFHDYLKDIPVSGIRKALTELFKILDTPEEKRDKYLEDDNPKLAAFPYVNGGLFADEEIEIPPFTEELKDLLLRKASEDFDWSGISPTIFGAVFESTLNPETRRSGGMHYTSIENIHKVIDPLFLNDLKTELEGILSITVLKTRNNRLDAFTDKLSKLKFLDPACGSGNFLTETYISLRRLENEVLRAKTNQITIDEAMLNPIKVSIGQFYGIEINDFAVTVAKTALWIAESQMMKETEDIIASHIDFLPLKSYANIVERNALRIDWESVVPKHELNYIMGNPPFVGYSHQSKEQKNELLEVLKIDEKTIKNAGKLDYVIGWYYKAIIYMYNTNIECAFVSTNSISQGEQPESIWKPISEKYNVNINFAYQPFKWRSESSGQAIVNCVIIGFSFVKRNQIYLYNNDFVKLVENINAYLLPANNIFIEKRKNPLCNAPEMMNGNRPTDDGCLSLTEEDLISHYKKRPQYIKKFVGSKEYLHNIKRYCFWIEPKDLLDVRNDSFAMDRISQCKQFREKSSKEATRKCADTPYMFQEIRQPTNDFVVLPVTTSEQRKYIPIGYLNKDIICSNALMIIPKANIYHFGVLMSNVHMAWMKAFTGRLEMRYQYSASVVYNNFPWCNPTEEQKQKIEQTAQAILDARALYPDSSLADLYDELTMPPELRRAHQANDRAVWEAYGKRWDIRSESACVAELMKMYQELTEK